MAKLFAAAAALLLLTTSASGQVIIGDCNIVVKTNNIDGHIVKHGDIGCPQDPNLALRVTYYWLDATSASLLVAGAVETRLTKLLGDRPFVIQNQTYKDLASLINRYGVRQEIGDHTDTYYVGLGTYSYDNQVKNQVELAPVRANRVTNVRVYDGSNPIYIPDFAAIRTTYATTDWPLNYQMYYSNRREGIDSDDDYKILIRTILWRHVAKDEIAKYGATIKQAQDKLQEIPKYVWWPNGTNPTLSDQETERLAAILDEHTQERQVKAEIKALPPHAQNRSVAAMAHFGAKSWPSDFLQAFGYMEDHGPSILGWGVVALPRRLFLQIAVIENIGGYGALYKVPTFSTLRSARTDLRTETDDADTTKELQPFVPGSIGRGDKIVLPLAIELRAHRAVGRSDIEEFLEPSEEAAAEILTAMRQAPTRVLTPESGVKIQKVASAFRDAVPPKTVSAYRFGTRTTLTQINTDRVQVPVRPYDSNHVYMVAGFMGGSCPILYTRRTDHESATKLGTVLRTANGQGAAQTEQYELGMGMAELTIAEEEPERTILTGLVISYDVEGDRRELYRLPAPVKLDFGEQLSIKIPPHAQDKSLRLELTGYYETYGELLALAGNAPTFNGGALGSDSTR